MLTDGLETANKVWKEAIFSSHKINLVVLVGKYMQDHNEPLATEKNAGLLFIHVKQYCKHLKGSHLIYCINKPHLPAVTQA